jgi:hypothetical protein
MGYDTHIAATNTVSSEPPTTATATTGPMAPTTLASTHSSIHPMLGQMALGARPPSVRGALPTGGYPYGPSLLGPKLLDPKLGGPPRFGPSWGDDVCGVHW